MINLMHNFILINQMKLKILDFSFFEINSPVVNTAEVLFVIDNQYHSEIFLPWVTKCSQ